MSRSTTPFNHVTTASTNAALIVAGDRTLYELTVFNPTATPVFVKLYNKASTPAPATDVPLVTIPVAAGTLVAYEFGSEGKDFALGIGRAVTANAPSNDNTAAVAGVIISGTRA
ncbi:hypothetical protein [Microbacterium sp. RG1]|uniref:hypothetical protein n=1 Tax=Microbacterium sp. RG1 TaxID=2489212 RepID=UPI0010CA5E84|nr:hypothetical protein [Microbacterium sp. RG1]QCQ16992.1 hypothetical protein EHF32_09820 [Microbacterium sp. RG1]